MHCTIVDFGHVNRFWTKFSGICLLFSCGFFRGCLLTNIVITEYVNQLLVWKQILSKLFIDKLLFNIFRKAGKMITTCITWIYLGKRGSFTPALIWQHKRKHRTLNSLSFLNAARVTLETVEEAGSSDTSCLGRWIQEEDCAGMVPSFDKTNYNRNIAKTYKHSKDIQS